jgi:ADP-ribosylglycohydrolase
MSPDRPQRALASLRGLAVGDALGSQFFAPANLDHNAGATPARPARSTNDQAPTS